MDEADEVRPLVRSLNDEQQGRAAEAWPLIPAAVRAFVRRHRCYARLFRHCDLDGVAQLAVVEASFTYDAAKSKPTTYYGSAIRHALLKEVKRVQRSRYGANERVCYAKALGLVFAPTRRQQMLQCLRDMPDHHRSLIESIVIEGKTLSSIARSTGRDWRTIKARLMRALEALRLASREHSETPSDIQDPVPAVRA